MEEKETNKFVIFRLGVEEYGIPIEKTEAIEKMIHIRSVPHMPHHVRGIGELRGSVIPIIDLRDYLKQGAREDQKETRILIIQGENFKAGFVVDEATEVLDIGEDQIQSLSQTGLETTHSPLVARFEKRLIILLNIESLLQEMNPGETLSQLVETIEEEGEISENA